MLHAVNNRKARLGAFRGAGIRVPLEDVVTSTVFGPLEFMSAEDRRRSIDLVCEALAVEIAERRGPMRVLFWPRLPVSDASLRTRYSEPDLMLADDVGPVMVVEIKWGASLSERELASQWTAIGSSGRRRAVHLLLVQEPGIYRRDVDLDREMVDAAGMGPWPLQMRNWRSLTAVEVLSRRADASEPVRAWASAVTAFLRREHRMSMHGWDEIGLMSVEEAEWTFRQRWFSEVRPVEAHGGWWGG